VVQARADQLSHIEALLGALGVNREIKIHEIIQAGCCLRWPGFDVGDRNHDGRQPCILIYVNEKDGIPCENM